MFLDFALGGFDLCCAGVFGGFADEFAARGDTFTQLASGYTGYTGYLFYSPSSVVTHVVVCRVQSKF